METPFHFGLWLSKWYCQHLILVSRVLRTLSTRSTTSFQMITLWKGLRKGNRKQGWRALGWWHRPGSPLQRLFQWSVLCQTCYTREVKMRRQGVQLQWYAEAAQGQSSRSVSPSSFCTSRRHSTASRPEESRIGRDSGLSTLWVSVAISFPYPEIKGDFG